VGSRLAATVSGLPTESTTFVGRRRELTEVRRSLGSTRLVTLTGVGGVGKTRLAMRAAARVARTFTGGVWLVELADLDRADSLVDSVVSALGLADGADPWRSLETFVAERHMLLLLDNCEHLLDDCAVLVERLLSVSSGLHILATSRQALDLVGERALSVAPLAVPSHGSAALDGHDGVALFVDRARATLAGFQVTDDNRALVVRLCQQLDGLPLAIELAATRLRGCSLAQLVELLGDRFAVLTAGNRSGPARQRSLRALVDWSYELCTERERVLWSRLSVFAGGFDLAAAERVCAGGCLDPAAVADTLETLIDKSVVLRTDHGGCRRYRLLETMRQYGHRRLVEAGARTVLGRRHREWCEWLLAQADLGWLGPDQLSSADRLRLEQANLQAAMEFCLSDDCADDRAPAFAATLCLHRGVRGPLSEPRRWLDHALRRVREPSTGRAKALWVNARLALLQGDTATARCLLDECGAVARVVGDDAAIAYVAQFSALADLFDGDPAKAVDGLTEAAGLHQAPDHGRTLHLIMARCFAGDRTAAAAVGESLPGPPASATDAYLSWCAAILHVTSGDPRGAAAPATDALRIAARVEDRWLESMCLETIAWSVAATGEHARAARLLGAAEMTRGQLGTSLAGLVHLHAQHDQAVRRARAGIGDPAFDAEYRAGAATTADQAVACGLGEPATAPADEPAGDSPLTSREREVAALVAAGLSNREIAAKLIIAPRTAATHVSRILTKLGFTARSQIAAWVAEGSTHPAQVTTAAFTVD
jgi:predicted ATPase/DNA-binding CsgD family transcriptional regulator